MQAMDDDAEIIHGVGFSKAIDITYEGVPEAQQTYAEMMEYLSQCNQGKTVPIEYLFTMGDDRYFDVLNRSSTFQKGRSIDLWTMYYDVDLDENGHRVGGTVGGADPRDGHKYRQWRKLPTPYNSHRYSIHMARWEQPSRTLWKYPLASISRPVIPNLPYFLRRESLPHL